VLTIKVIVEVEHEGRRVTMNITKLAKTVRGDRISFDIELEDGKFAQGSTPCDDIEATPQASPSRSKERHMATPHEFGWAKFTATTQHFLDTSPAVVRYRTDPKDRVALFEFDPLVEVWDSPQNVHFNLDEAPDEVVDLLEELQRPSR
jgi:hypothetical protein